MPAARYWRAVGLSAYGGGDVELSEFQLFGTGGRLDAPAALTCTLPPVSGALANLKDADTATLARFNPRSPGFALQWDFGSGNTADVAVARIGSSTSQALFLSHFDLQYSTDGATWQLLSRQGRFPWPGANALTTASVGDVNYSSIALLLHGDGANGSTTFVDNSPFPKSILASGTARISTAHSKFGGASIRLEGAGGHVYANNIPELRLTAGNYTIECFFRADALTASQCLMAQRTNTPSVLGWGIFLDADGSLYIQGNTGSPTFISTPASTYAALTWHHLAIVRSGSTTTIYVDGVVKGSGNAAWAEDDTSVFSIGYQRQTGQYPLFGYIDEVRITAGVARYTGAFAPPTAAFPDVTSTADLSLLVATSQVASAEPFYRENITGAVGAKPTADARPVRDIFMAGRGAIVATVKEDGEPTDTPVRRKVRLFRDRDGLMVRETWSNATTGAYAFTEIDENETYSVVSYDHNNNFRAVIADRITPTVP